MHTPKSINKRSRLMALLISLGCAVTCSTVAPANSVEAEIVQPQTVSGRVALSWAALYMSDNHDYSAAEATGLAKKFDLVTAMPMALKHYSTTMKQTNPALTLLSYSNATLLRKAKTVGLPESSFAHNSSGQRIVAPEFDSYLMESTDATWRKTANAQCNSRSAEGGFDGCLVDMLGLGVFSKGYVSSLPANPVSRSTYTQAEYRDRMASLSAYYSTQSPSLIHIGNAVQNSYRYWLDSVPSRPLVAGMPSAQMEDFLRGAGNSVTAYPTAANWLRNVDVIRDMESRGQVGLFTTKVWTLASSSQIAAWQKYSMASFLMGANGKSYFAFTRSRDKAGAMQSNVPYTMPKDIGLPRGAMVQQSSGAYTRSFARGMSLVNPGTSTVTVKLPTAMRTLAGSTVTSVTLPAHSGEVVVG